MKPMSERLPEGWSRKRIDDLGQLYSGATPSTYIDSYWGDEIVWVTPNDLSTLRTRHIKESERRITALGLQNCSAHLLPKGSLIISSRAPIGYLAIAQTEFCTNQGCKSLVFSSDHDPDFHYYNLSFRVRAIREKGEGTTFAEISKTALASIEVPVPDDKAEQTAIADILTTVDQAIEQTEALIAKQRRIKAGLLHDLLTRGIDEHGHLRDPSTHRFKPSPVGLVPEEWEVRDFDGFGIEIIDGDRGANYPNEHELSNSGYCLFLTNKNIHQGNLDFAVKQFVSQERDTLLGKGKLIVGDQVITTRGTVGNIAKFDETSPYQNVRINSGMVIIRGYGTWFSPDFFVYLWLEFFQKQYSMMSSGSAQPQLPIKDLRRFYLLAPTIAEQKQIAAFLHSADTLIGVERDSHQKLRVLKTGLMQDLLSGRVSVAGLAARSSGSPLGAPIDDHTLS